MNTRRVLLAAALVVVALAVAAGAGCGDSESDGKAEIAYIGITADDNEGTVPAEVFDVVTVSLPENPSTGYAWEATLTPGLAVTSSAYEPDDASGSAEGSGGMRVWKIRVEEAGESRFMATLYPPDGELPPDAERFTVKIVAE
jgi:predicted secreted protein